MSTVKRQSLVFIIVTTAFASCISMLGGLGIEVVEANLLPIIPLVIALPALNTMVGDYATIIAAHAGNPSERSASRKKLVKSIATSVIVNIVGTIVLSLVFAYLRNYNFDTLFVIKFSGFVLVSVVAIVSVMFGITYTLDRLLETRKLNPDDILIPIVTTVTDVFMLGLIALSTAVVF